MLQRILLALFSLSFLASPAFAGFEEGKTAYYRKNYPRALYELSPLAEEGNDLALILLGNMYNDGNGVEQDSQKALTLYKRAATEKNNTDAMIYIAAMYNAGLGAKKNPDLAVQWFERAARLGNQTGAFFYAMSLFQKKEPDFYNSYKWFRIAGRDKLPSRFKREALGTAKMVADEKLKPEEIAKANKEADEWKPADAASLGPPPVEADTAEIPAPKKKP